MPRLFRIFLSLLVIASIAVVTGPTGALAQTDENVAETGDTTDTDTAADTNVAPDSDAASDSDDEGKPKTAFGEPAGLVRLSKQYALWIDPKRKHVVVDGRVCLREGQLEMFACPKGTKEHESVVALDCKAEFVHAALLAIGAEAGKPVSFDPEYAPASGDPIEVVVLWKDKEGGRHKTRAQEWIKHVRTGKAMPYDWVFGGSGFWTSPETGDRHYFANDGDLICVSNFSSATLDLPVQSSQANSQLLFTAFTERIPPVGTPVRLVLFVKPDKKAKSVSVAPERESPDDDGENDDPENDGAN